MRLLACLACIVCLCACLDVSLRDLAVSEEYDDELPPDFPIHGAAGRLPVFDIPIEDEYAEPDGGIKACPLWRESVAKTQAEAEVLRDGGDLDPKGLVASCTRFVQLWMEEPPMWDRQSAFLARRVSEWMRWRWWRKLCIVCATRKNEFGCGYILEKWLMQLSMPYILIIVRVPELRELNLDNRSEQEWDAMYRSAVFAEGSSKSSGCNFMILVVSNVHRAFNLTNYEPAIWTPTASQVVLLLDAAPWLHRLRQSLLHRPPPAPPTNRADLIQLFRGLWDYRRVQRVILYQTARPGRFMAVDLPRRRTRNICAEDSWGIWEVLSANMTNLRGLPVRVTMFPRRPTAVALRLRAPTGSVPFLGFDAWVLGIFAKTLNCTVEVRGTADGKRFGYNVNGTYTGTLRELVTGYADIAFNQHFILDYNSHEVMPSVAVDFDALCVVVPRVEDATTLMQFLNSISLSVLLMFAITTSTLIAVFWIISYHAPRRPDLNDSFFYMFAVVCGAPVVPLPQICSQRMLIGACAIFSVVATNSFQSLVSTNLAASRGASQMKTLRELDESGLLIFTGSDSLRSTTFQGDQPLLQRLLLKVVLPANSSEYDRMTRGHTVAWLNRRNSATNTDSWYLLPECPRDYFVAYLLPYSSAFLDPLNKMLYRLQSTGVLDFLSRITYHALMTQEKAAGSKDSPHKMSLVNMHGIFTLFIAGHIMAVLAILGEIMAHRMLKYLRAVPLRRGLPRRPRRRGRGSRRGAQVTGPPPGLVQYVVRVPLAPESPASETPFPFVH